MHHPFKFININWLLSFRNQPLRSNLAQGEFQHRRRRLLPLRRRQPRLVPEARGRQEQVRLRVSLRPLRGWRQQAQARRQPVHRLRTDFLPVKHRYHHEPEVLRHLVERSGMSQKDRGRSHIRKLQCRTVPLRIIQ